VAVQDAGGRIVYANQAAAVILGFPSPETLLSAGSEGVLAAHELLDEAGEPLAVAAAPGRRVLAGERPGPLVVMFRNRETGALRWSVLKARPVFGSDGAVAFVVNTIEDVTEQKEAEQALRFLAESSRILGSSLDYETTLRSVADLVVPRIADWCAIDLLGEDGAIAHVATAHVDPAKLELAAQLRMRYPPDPSAPTGVPNVLRTGRAEVYSEIPDALLQAVARDAEHLELIRSVGMNSAAIVPMIARGRTVGALTLVNSESARGFRGDRDLDLAWDLARRASVAVDNARLYTERSHVARVLQESLLPPTLPRVPGLEFGTRYRPARQADEVGGDFYDVFPTGRGSWGVVIGDITGKGPDAAALTALARHTVRAGAVGHGSPAAVLRVLNDALLAHRLEERFCTVAYAVIRTDNTGRTRLQLASGGHPLPLLLRANGAVHEVGRSGTALGVLVNPELPEDTLELDLDDALVLFTDGVPEAGAPERFFSPEDLGALLAGSAGLGAPALAARLEEGILPAGGPGPRDDIAILVTRLVPRTPEDQPGADRG
jgi:PAS domain S-box-containing protein